MVLTLLLGTVLLEWLFYRVAWRLRTPIIMAFSAAVPTLTVFALFQYPGWITALVAFFSIFRLLNWLRIAKARMHTAYLLRAARRTSYYIGIMQIIAIACVYVAQTMNASNPLAYISAAVVGVSLLLLFITTKNIFRTKYRQGTTFYADKELPSVSLLIPARNETSDLEECLRSALASNYPKLEIIVLDDCSHLKTSEVIKAFAHDGVRFVKGLPPAQNWLAKNQAYEKLAAEASGSLLLFCGIDVRFGQNSIKALVTEYMSRDKAMISVLPHRLSGNIAGAFVQPMRYWWELSLPRKVFNRPPVLSTCWLIHKKSLRRLGGFKAVSRSILPEGYFAREYIKDNKYSFIRANDTLDIQTRKSSTEQRATAVRTTYPQLRRRPENVAVVLLAQCLFILGPFIGLVYSLVTSNPSALLFALAASILVINHLIIVYFTSPANVVIALFSLPVEIAINVVLLVQSMLRYEFGEVHWKDRNICLPVMHVIPKLPTQD